MLLVGTSKRGEKGRRASGCVKKRGNEPLLTLKVGGAMSSGIKIVRKINETGFSSTSRKEHNPATT